MKVCSKCGTSRELIEFDNDRSRPSGKFPQCKPCRSEDSKSPSGKARSKRYYTSEKCHKNRRRYKKLPAQLAANNALEMKRYAKKLKATPPWLTEEHFDLMKMEYEKAHYLTEVTGVKWEVDHIIPLQGQNISGLHVPWNLRVITKEENVRKNNKVI